MIIFFLFCFFCVDGIQQPETSTDWYVSYCKKKRKHNFLPAFTYDLTNNTAHKGSNHTRKTKENDTNSTLVSYPSLSLSRFVFIPTTGK